MKKFASLIMSMLILCALCIPASAEENFDDVFLTYGCWRTVDSEIEMMSGSWSVQGGTGICIAKNGYLTGTLEMINFEGGEGIFNFVIENGGGLCITFYNSGCADYFAGVLSSNGINYYRNGNTIQAGVCKHTDNVYTVCNQCGKPIPGATGLTLSEGSLTLLCTVAGLVVGFVAAMFIFKKKKPAVADAEITADTEKTE